MTGTQDVDTALRTASSVSTGTEPTANAGPSGDIEVENATGKTGELEMEVALSDGKAAGIEVVPYP